MFFGDALSRGGKDAQIKINHSYDNASTWISDRVLISAASYTIIMLTTIGTVNMMYLRCTCHT